MNLQKKAVTFFSATVLLVFILLLGGCELLSIFASRINSFVSALNQTGVGRAAIITTNFHDDMVSKPTWNDDVQMNGTEIRDSYRQFGVSLAGSPVDLGGGVKSQNGTLTSSSPASPQTIEFRFKENGSGNWMILWMRCGGQTWQ